MPNVFETLYNTPSHLMDKQKQSTNSPKALSSTIIFIFVIALSTYHLLLLSVMRFYAIKFPLRYKQLKKANGVKILVAAWCTALLVALLPRKCAFSIMPVHYVSGLKKKHPVR